MAEQLGCDTKTIDNALQRVKRKIITHQQTAKSGTAARNSRLYAPGKRTPAKPASSYLT